MEGPERSLVPEPLDSALRRQLNFAGPQKIRDLVDRTPTKMQSEQKQALEYAIELGMGGMWLQVTAEQYAVLCR